MNIYILCPFLLLIMSMTASAQCYIIFDKEKKTIYEDSLPPFPLDLPPNRHNEWEASISRGEHLVIVPQDCTSRVDVISNALDLTRPPENIKAESVAKIVARIQEFINAPKGPHAVYGRPAKDGCGGGGGGGPCMSPDDIAADGSRCGARAASVRPGGI